MVVVIKFLFFYFLFDDYDPNNDTDNDYVFFSAEEKGIVLNIT